MQTRQACLRAQRGGAMTVRPSLRPSARKACLRCVARASDTNGGHLKAGNQAVIKVFGVGGGGSNAVNNMVQSGTCQGVEFWIANTDSQVRGGAWRGGHEVHAPLGRDACLHGAPGGRGTP